MITISLCMIVKNEEEVLARCLDSIKDLVDEINIVDTGSTDKTVEIAKKYTDRVFFFEWTGRFKDARNESFKYATKDYILYLDADDVLMEEDRKKFKLLKETLEPEVDSVSMYYNAGVDEYGNVTLRYRRNRLLKRSRHFQWQGDVHNYIAVSGNIVNSDIAITHLKNKHAVGRNLSIYKEKIANGDPFTPRDYFYYGNELRENQFYKEAIESYSKVIEMDKGWVEDKVYACMFRADCHRFLGNAKEELSSLLLSIAFSKTPRPEVCSRIGYHFQQQRDYQSAIFWYELATSLHDDPNKWSFTYPAYSTWYPHLQLCVCYYHLNEIEKSYEHNEKAREYRPKDERILFNKKMLESKLRTVSQER
ncbi:glycosyltransferase involved in cell wall biosynthesis [Bacillus thermophilus]|uniref:Glycosyltransferase involved in cell wall biosynthesis n=1 Tax=Siminovitchia thermophila TaxID=1245522 RepID=A0ABS2RDE3_9BACI|nr:glycosyltransferase family 2 protein [Siminovitchia thermophila]MBM7717670.1 glycosyltransferase involved in cell wall biosynthesis [Siminovitchia thermophila]ONK22357.1 glycosyl transferase [Bacillus sp. VT-16-64]